MASLLTADARAVIGRVARFGGAVLALSSIPSIFAADSEEIDPAKEHRFPIGESLEAVETTGDYIADLFVHGVAPSVPAQGEELRVPDVVGAQILAVFERVAEFIGGAPSPTLMKVATKFAKKCLFECVRAHSILHVLQDDETSPLIPGKDVPGGLSLEARARVAMDPASFAVLTNHASLATLWLYRTLCAAMDRDDRFRHIDAKKLVKREVRRRQKEDRRGHLLPSERAALEEPHAALASGLLGFRAQEILKSGVPLLDDPRAAEIQRLLESWCEDVSSVASRASMMSYLRVLHEGTPADCA
jgi:hypothetical protein